MAEGKPWGLGGPVLAGDAAPRAGTRERPRGAQRGKCEKEPRRQTLAGPTAGAPALSATRGNELKQQRWEPGVLPQGLRWERGRLGPDLAEDTCSAGRLGNSKHLCGKP